MSHSSQLYSLSMNVKNSAGADSEQLHNDIEKIRQVLASESEDSSCSEQGNLNKLLLTYPLHPNVGHKATMSLLHR